MIGDQVCRQGGVLQRGTFEQFDDLASVRIGAEHREREDLSGSTIHNRGKAQPPVKEPKVGQVNLPNEVRPLGIEQAVGLNAVRFEKGRLSLPLTRLVLLDGFMNERLAHLNPTVNKPAGQSADADVAFGEVRPKQLGDIVDLVVVFVPWGGGEPANRLLALSFVQPGSNGIRADDESAGRLGRRPALEVLEADDSTSFGWRVIRPSLGIESFKSIDEQLGDIIGYLGIEVGTGLTQPSILKGSGAAVQEGPCFAVRLGDHRRNDANGIPEPRRIIRLHRNHSAANKRAA